MCTDKTGPALLGEWLVLIRVPISRLLRIGVIGVLLSACAETRVLKADQDHEGTGYAGAFLIGKLAQNTNDFTRAADHLAKVLITSPHISELQRRAFLAYLADGRFDAAAALAESLIADSAHGQLFMVLSLVHRDIKAGDFGKARSHLQHLPDRKLTEIMRPVLEAWLLAGEDKYAEALERLTPALDTGGFKRLVSYHSGLIARQAGDARAAERFLEQAYGQPETASVRVVEQLGHLFEATGRKERAELLFKAYLDRHPQSLIMPAHLARLKTGAPPRRLIVTPEQGLAEMFLDFGAILAGENAADRSLIFARHADDLRPDDPTTRLLLGEIMDAMDRPEDAIEIYRSVPVTAALAWDTRVRAAGNLQRIGKSDQAISLLSELAGERPERADVLLSLGDVLRRKERYEDAAEAYAEAIRRLGGFDQAGWQLLFRRGMALERAQQWQHAEKYFLKALELEPDQPSVLNYLGYSWVDRGENLKQARTMIERAVALRPNSGYIVDSLGWVLYRLGDFAGAVTHLEKAVELQAEDPTINDHLGDAYWRVNRLHEARFQWRRVLSLDPEDDLRARVKEKLENGLSDGQDI